MHEVDMTRALLHSLEEWRNGHSPHCPQVQRVHLRVGEFTCVEPAALIFTWAGAVRHTWLEGSLLQIERVPLLARCLDCGGTYAPTVETAYRSPCCAHPMEEILSGRELKISHIDYDLDTPAPAAERSTPFLFSSP